jgi:MFS family permease
MLSAAIVVVILMTPTYLQKQLAIAPTAALQANSLATVTLTLGCIFFGWLNDRINSGLVFIVGSIGLAVTTYVFYHGVAADPSLLLVLYPLVGFFVGIELGQIKSYNSCFHCISLFKISQYLLIHNEVKRDTFGISIITPGL